MADRRLTLVTRLLEGTTVPFHIVLAYILRGKVDAHVPITV